MNEKRSMEELGRISAEEFKASAKLPVILILDNIRSGLNVGSIFRSADAFRIEKIYCCGYTPSPPHREVLKSALGATETIKWESVEDTISVVKNLRSSKILCYAMEQTHQSVSISDFRPNGLNAIAIVLGNEVSGVAQHVIDECDGAVEIDQYGTKHSLNVAVCAGIALFALRSKFSEGKS